MDKKDRKFAVPFNGTKPETYLKTIQPYIQNIDSVYFGLPGIIENNNDVLGNANEILSKEANTFEFLSLTKENFPKRLLVMNSIVYDMSPDEIDYWIYKNLLPIREIYGVQGIIIADFNFAKRVRKLIPDIEIQTSCNAMHNSISNYRRWKEEINVSTFNPPRDILRFPERLKEVHNAGFRIKCLINELCIVGCPEHCSHFVHCATGIPLAQKYCASCSKLSDVLKCGFIIPQWYDFYDQYVDVYKISGRNSDNTTLKSMLDCFIGCNENADFFRIMMGQPKDVLCSISPYSFSIKNISRKLIDCEQKDCDNCNICKSIILKHLKRNNIEINDVILKKL